MCVCVCVCVCVNEFRGMCTCASLRAYNTSTHASTQDMNGGGPTSTEPVENVFFGDLDRGIEAVRGNYRVVVQNYAYHEKRQDVPVPFRIIVRKNGEAAGTEFPYTCTHAHTLARSLACMHARMHTRAQRERARETGGPCGDAARKKCQGAAAARKSNVAKVWQYGSA